MAPIRKVRALLIDLSGTLHVGSEPIKGAVRAIERLREANVPFRFCSNTSKESTSALIGRLSKAGFNVHANETFTSLGAMRKLLRDKGIKRPYLMLSPSAEEDFAEFKSTEDVAYDAVVVGLAPTKFTYENMSEAFRILSSTPTSNSIPLLATHRARYVRAQSGELVLGPGPFISALETAVGNGLKAEVVGKPEKTFFEVCLRDMGVVLESEPTGDEIRVEDVAVIGDDVEADLAGGAIELGLKRMLVKTGKYRPGDEDRSSTPPDAVFDSIGDLVEALLSDRSHL
ncbi:hypothetical protein PIIN_03925 [Serendipita indica DSM 11827]|uniref:Haloacid dehalogenase-like hydrolase domain-containing protein 2 n=1 Tax=Serendipita indica (strain DSM 11827) TaxID=1109443 RepID=G4TF92_SERID|nr:hypothetical protein PIIN_03925 [Serendipita indica DSM 11827]